MMGMQPGQVAMIEAQERREQAEAERERIERQIAAQDRADLAAMHQDMLDRQRGYSDADLRAAWIASSEAAEAAGLIIDPAAPRGSALNPEQLIDFEPTVSRSAALDADQLLARHRAGQAEFRQLVRRHEARARSAEIARIEAEIAVRDQYGTGSYYRQANLFDDSGGRYITRDTATYRGGFGDW